jgi:type VI secretion system secreted protein VgrG
MDDTLTVKAGDYSMKVSAGQATFDAMTKITLKCGQSTIVMTPASIEIKSVAIKVEAQATLDTKAGAMSQNDGGPMMIIKGAMTMIN